MVKFYADEAGTDAVRSLDCPLLIATIARVEVPAAIWRKQRIGEMTSRDAQILCAAFAADAAGNRFSLVDITQAILGEAAALVARHPLRAYDSLQLACALATRRAGVEAQFGCFDDQLNRAAAAEGLVLLAA